MQCENAKLWEGWKTSSVQCSRKRAPNRISRFSSLSMCLASGYTVLLPSNAAVFSFFVYGAVSVCVSLCVSLFRAVVQELQNQTDCLISADIFRENIRSRCEQKINATTFLLISRIFSHAIRYDSHFPTSDWCFIYPRCRRNGLTEATMQRLASYFLFIATVERIWLVVDEQLTFEDGRNISAGWQHLETTRATTTTATPEKALTESNRALSLPLI